jgi:hypothetical protein
MGVKNRGAGFVEGVSELCELILFQGAADETLQAP